MSGFLEADQEKNRGFQKAAKNHLKHYRKPITNVK